MSRFFEVDMSPEPSIIGVKNGLYQVEFKDRDLNKNENIDEILELLSTYPSIPQQVIKDLKIDYLEGTIKKRAKLTDFMGYCPYFLCYYSLISDRVLDVIKKWTSPIKEDAKLS